MHRKLLGRIEIMHTSTVIGMDEPPVQACRKKPDASVMLAAKTVQQGQSFGFFSPGNTGATVASAIMKIGLLPWVKKPAILTPLPTVRGYTLLLDSGASIDITPEQFVDLARLGIAFVNTVFSKKNAAIGLINIGTEHNKGNAQVQKAYALLKEAFPSFSGNIEGHDLYSGKTDIVLCDGFVGNIILKLSEGINKEIVKITQSRAKRAQKTGNSDIQLKKLEQLEKKTEQRFSRSMRRVTDPENYGGAALLGINGIVLVGHGKAKSRAVYNAIRNALYYHSRNLVDKLRDTGPDTA